MFGFLVHTQIDGMTCSSCVHMIERTLLEKEGIEKAVVALSTCRGHIEFDPSILGVRDIVQIVKVHCHVLECLSSQCPVGEHHFERNILRGDIPLVPPPPDNYLKV